MDDDTSQDHDFGCRLTLLVNEADADEVPRLTELLEAQLPESFEGRLVRIPTSWDSGLGHKVDVATVADFATSRLGINAAGDLRPEDWLCLTGQSVLEVVGGPIFWDETSEYPALVRRLSWYPNDLWLYVLSASWAGLSQELPFVGRTGQRGDDIGSRVIAARLARDLVHLAFLLSRRWSPYPKWAAGILMDLAVGPPLVRHLSAALSAQDWKAREDGLCAGAEHLAQCQEDIGLPSPRPAVQGFFDRPFRVANPAIHEALFEVITDPEVRRLPRHIGSIEQWCDNVDLLAQSGRRAMARDLYLQLASSDAQPNG